MNGSTETRRHVDRRAIRGGYTMVELVIVVLIGGLMAVMAVPRVSGAADEQVVRSARTTFQNMARRARATAVERGELAWLVARPAADTLWLVTSSGDTVEVADFRGQGVDLKVASGDLTVCYSPRGFAHPACGDGASLPVRVGFQRGSAALEAELGVTGLVRVE